jgi:hypothetical protein
MEEPDAAAAHPGDGDGFGEPSLGRGAAVDWNQIR